MKKLSASNASQWMSCHASTDLEAAIPGFVATKDETFAASKGTAMHDVLALALDVGTNRDLQDIVSMLDYVAELRKERRFKMLVEYQMLTSWMVRPSVTTADVILYLQDELHVIDHKTGGTVVDPDSPQLLTYAAAAMAEGLAPKAEGVWVHVNQPRADNQVKTWISRADIALFVAEQMEHERQILAGDLAFGPSPAACTFCMANPASRGSVGKGELCKVAAGKAYRLDNQDKEFFVALQNAPLMQRPRVLDEL